MYLKSTCCARSCCGLFLSDKYVAINIFLTATGWAGFWGAKGNKQKEEINIGGKGNVQ